MKRRSFLALLGLAPAAPLAAKIRALPVPAGEKSPFPMTMPDRMMIDGVPVQTGDRVYINLQGEGFDRVKVYIVR